MTCWIEDLGSRNGTYVTGHPVKGKTEVVWGDEIHLGNCDLILCMGPQVEAVEESPVGSSPPPPPRAVTTTPLAALLKQIRGH
jgi:pSer/pThr/pTyr-binding forkhead associated (FHA) protein